MKTTVLRAFSVVGFFCAAPLSFSAVPSKAVQSSCLVGEATSTAVNVVELARNLISEQENYADGYDAVYYFLDGKTEIGYGEKSGKGGVIYAGKIYPIEHAKVISMPHSKPSEFSPALASWNRVRDASGAYLCVNFNFDGIGRSGSFQNFKGGYLLRIGRGRDKLYYIEGNVGAIRRQ